MAAQRLTLVWGALILGLCPKSSAARVGGLALCIDAGLPIIALLAAEISTLARGALHICR